jgi:two-component system, NarL family, nitrate/nitrite response regulator NarL
MPTSVSLLEGERLVCEALTGLLTHAGHRVLSACACATDFLDALAERPPQVALVGSRVGTDAYPQQGLVQEVALRHPRVLTLVLVDSGEEAHMARYLDAGAAQCLERSSASAAMLLSAVEAAIRGERLAGPLPWTAPTPPHATSRRALLESLTPREHEVLRHVSGGADNADIAAHLALTDRTVRGHLSSLYRKLECENRAQMALLARELGLTPLPGARPPAEDSAPEAGASSGHLALRPRARRSRHRGPGRPRPRAARR